MNKRGIATLRRAASVLFDHAQMQGDLTAGELSQHLDEFADRAEIDLGIRKPVESSE